MQEWRGNQRGRTATTRVELHEFYPLCLWASLHFVFNRIKFYYAGSKVIKLVQEFPKIGFIRWRGVASQSINFNENETVLFFFSKY